MLTHNKNLRRPVLGAAFIVASATVFLGDAKPVAAEVVTFTDRISFDAVAGDLDVEDFTTYAGTGCNAFANIPQNDCGPGPTVRDFGGFSIEATARPVIRPGVNLVTPDLHLRVSGAAELQIGGQAGITSNYQTTAIFMFDGPQTAFGIDKAQQSAPFTVTLRNDAGEIDSFEVSEVSSFFGVTSDEPYTELEIIQGLHDLVVYDNVAYEPVPEPTTLLLLTVAGGFMALLRRPRRVSRVKCTTRVSYSVRSAQGIVL